MITTTGQPVDARDGAMKMYCHILLNPRATRTDSSGNLVRQWEFHAYCNAHQMCLQLLQHFILSKYAITSLYSLLAAAFYVQNHCISFAEHGFAIVHPLAYNVLSEEIGNTKVHPCTVVCMH